jgi:hypothetical protein
MAIKYHIVLNMRRCSGFERYAVFDIGTNRPFAETLFASLLGTDDVTETDIVHMDLIETNRGLPLSLKVKSCSIDDLALNGRIITKELFKRWVLEDSI